MGAMGIGQLIIESVPTIWLHCSLGTLNKVRVRVLTYTWSHLFFMVWDTFDLHPIQNGKPI